MSYFIGRIRNNGSYTFNQWSVILYWPLYKTLSSLFWFHESFPQEFEIMRLLFQLLCELWFPKFQSFGKGKLKKMIHCIWQAIKPEEKREITVRQKLHKFGRRDSCQCAYFINCYIGNEPQSTEEKVKRSGKWIAWDPPEFKWI